MDQQLEALHTIVTRGTAFLVDYSFQVVGAIIILIGGFLLGSWVSTAVSKLCEKREIDVTLGHFLSSLAKIVVIGFAVIIALSKFGITIAPFIAAIGAAAFGATYALQGPLSNYGAGLAIILGRTFLVGDTITVAGVFGVVETITLAHTTLRTEDGVRITVPNKHIVGEILHNSGEHRIVESSVGISYSADPARAIAVISQALAGFPQLQNGPAPQIGIEDFQDSSVAIGYRYWAPTQRYIETMHAVNLAVYQALGQAGITIPFPQRVVTIMKDQNLS
ncbi:mechanosensitive ion channel family protein [Thiovibrio frasassiensis]|uniref:Mechanosensitive ion channel family protein n=1 Tax=Thiovibrio frasassiensis TaxID=2984131 RepID=A0A9X4MER7_9BACT|nr:mechanosensitive ion channel family protein [Thiovibrio frasassiensis]MDG4475891.1 mechanosensitive ion channel family protein [Thiovibrio frasassiensis]